MESKYEKITELGLDFKNIVSGPAPVGRILNYLKLVGQGKLKHKKGNRDLTLHDGIGYAWTTEFMVGLGLVSYDDSRDTVVPLKLTTVGQELYELIANSANFDEDKNPTKCKEELLAFSNTAYLKFESIFKSSVVCKNLCHYIANKQTNKFKKSDFLNDYFGTLKKFYTGEDYIYTPNSSATTGDNRVPSLIQLCQFFNAVVYEGGYYVFNVEKLNNHSTSSFIEIDEKVVTKLSDEEKTSEKIVDDLVSKYGIDGTVAREIITRNSSVQEIFRNNLKAKYGCECAICGKNIDMVLIASHIKPASQSNVIEKANCENGLLLCALHDKLFDRYLISFDFNSGKLIYAKELEDKLDDYQLSKDFILDEKFMTKERKEFLMEHNLEFYERNK